MGVSSKKKETNSKKKKKHEKTTKKGIKKKSNFQVQIEDKQKIYIICKSFQSRSMFHFENTAVSTFEFSQCVTPIYEYCLLEKSLSFWFSSEYNHSKF